MLRHKNDRNQFSSHVTTSVITLIILENQVIDSQCKAAHKDDQSHVGISLL